MKFTNTTIFANLFNARLVDVQYTQGTCYKHNTNDLPSYQKKKKCIVIKTYALMLNFAIVN